MFRQTITTTILVFFLVAGWAASTSRAEGPVELGLTPSPVYGLWREINSAALVYAKLRMHDENWQKQLTAMKPGKFSNKTPSNVLERVNQFRVQLKKLNADYRVSAAALLDDRLPGLLSIDGGLVTPSLIYLHSGQALVEMAWHILQLHDESIRISPFFTAGNYTEKSPSDVYGLVDLAVRRLAQIATQQLQSNTREKGIMQ